MKRFLHISNVGWFAIWMGIVLFYFAPYGCLCGTQRPPEKQCKTSADCAKNEECVGDRCVAKPPVSHCQLKTQQGYCIEHNGPYHETKERQDSCQKEQGTFESFRACDKTKSIGHCALRESDKTSKIFFYHSDDWDTTKAQEHCKKQSGSWNSSP